MIIENDFGETQMLLVYHLYNFFGTYRRPASLLVLYEANLSKLMNFYSPRNHQETYSFVMISRRSEVHLFPQILLRIEVKFATIPYVFGSMDFVNTDLTVLTC